MRGRETGYVSSVMYLVQEISDQMTFVLSGWLYSLPGPSGMTLEWS